MHRNIINNKGFTLVEVLAAVALLAIISVFAINSLSYIINTSKNKAVSLSYDTITKAAELYSKEVSSVSSWWGYESGDVNYRFYCVTIQDLINKGYFGEDLVNKSISSENGITNNSLIKIVKDMNNKTVVRTTVTNETNLNKCNNELSDSVINDSDNIKFTYDFNRGRDNDYSIIELDKQTTTHKLLEIDSSIEYFGYIFNGWYSRRHGGTKIGDAGTEINLVDRGINYDITLYAHWIPDPNYKRVDIQLDVNGGTLAADSGPDFGLNGSLLTKAGSITMHTIVLGQTIGSKGLFNWNSPGNVNLVNPGYTIKSASAWCKTPNSDGSDCYSQTTTSYGFKDFCKDTSKNCTVTLYANWVKARYDIRFVSGLGLDYPKTWTDDSIVFDGNTSWSLGLYEFNVATIYVKFSTNAIGDAQNIIGNQDASGYGLRIGTDGKLRGELYIDTGDDEGYLTVTSKEALVANKEYTAVLTYGSQKLVLYLDGVLQDSKSLSGTVMQSYNTVLRLGCNPKGISSCDGSYFKGKISSIKIFARGMPIGDINKIDDKDTMHLQLYKEINVNKKDFNVLRVTRNAGEAIGTLPRSYKLGYTLDGWYTDEETPRKITKDEIIGPPPEGKNATTYNAKWKANTYTIKFDGNGAASGSTADVSCTYDKDCKLTTNGFTNPGYNFAGWSKVPDGDVVYTNGQTVKNVIPSGEITLYAKWEAKQLKITLDNQGATNAGTSMIYLRYNYRWFLDKNETKWMKPDQNPITLPTKTGYNFNGYFTGTDGSGDQIINDSGYIIAGKIRSFSSDGSLYAKWTTSTEKPILKFTPAGSPNLPGTTIVSGTQVKVSCSTSKGIYYFVAKDETGDRGSLGDGSGNISTNTNSIETIIALSKLSSEVPSGRFIEATCVGKDGASTYTKLYYNVISTGETASTYYVNVDPGDHLNCRSGQGVNFGVVTSYGCGTAVTVDNTSSSWYHITNNNCYSNSSYLKKTKPSCDTSSTPSSHSSGSSCTWGWSSSWQVSGGKFCDPGPTGYNNGSTKCYYEKISHSGCPQEEDLYQRYCKYYRCR